MQLADDAHLNGYNVLVINPTVPAFEEDEVIQGEFESSDFSNHIYIQ